MERIVVFAGTNEGRKLCEFLAGRGVEVTAVVATEYGSLVMPDMPFLTVREGRLSLEEISELIKAYDFVVDATHPYARVISENIKQAVLFQAKKMLRVVRPSLEYENVIECTDISDACRYLKGTSGNILVTTGSKELKPYTNIESFGQRIFLRVLPTVEAINTCLSLGFRATNIICMQGPFSENMNKATMEQIDAKFLVTKETGKSGGFMEKLSAAKQLGVKVVLIGRPYREDGITLEEAQSFFEKELRLVKKLHSHFPMFFNLRDKKIVVVGGGRIATRRIEVLVCFDARITVVASHISERLHALYNENKLELVERDYESDDIKDAFMVIAATNSREINEKIFSDAHLSGVFVNTSDRKEQCDFYFPSIFEDEEVIGGLISKEGNNHTAAKEKASSIRAYLREGR